MAVPASLANRTHAAGYWATLGLAQASFDFCEDNFTNSIYVAELVNTLSSVPLFLVGVASLAIALHERYELRFVVAAVLTSFVGLGSIAFHATLLFAGQMLDEMSMIWAVTALLVCVGLESGSSRKGPSQARRLLVPLAAALYMAAFTAAYLMASKFYVFFVASFAVLVVYTLISIWRLLRRVPDESGGLVAIFNTVVVVTGLSFFTFWLPDVLACSQLAPLHLHAAWHLAGCLPPAWLLAALVAQRYAARFRRRTGRVVEISTGRLLSATDSAVIYAPLASPPAGAAAVSAAAALAGDADPAPSSAASPLVGAAGGVLEVEEEDDEEGGCGVGAGSDLAVPQLTWRGWGCCRWPVVRLNRKFRLV